MNSLAANARRAALRYGVAILAVILAWLLRQALDPYLGDIQPFATFYVAITFVAWWAGTRPALVAMILGYFAAHWFFLPPRHALALENFADVVQHVAYFFVTGTTVFLIYAMRRSQQRERASAQLEQKRLEDEADQRRQVEEQLRYQLQLFESITDTAAVCIFVTDERGRVTFMNPEAERVFGFTLEELRGQCVHAAVHHHYPSGEPFPVSECPMMQVYESGMTSRSYEEVLFRKDGTSLPVVCSNAALWKEGRIAGAVIVAQDITQRKRFEQALRQAKEQLARANAGLEKQVAERTEKLQEALDEIEHFSYSITHDMRAPLRAIQSYASLLREELCAGCLHSCNLDFIHRIQAASHRMDNLIQDFLAYNTAARQTVPLQVVDLAKLLRALVDTYANLQAHAAHISLPTEMPLVLGNEAALTLCFSNLLGNAVKFVAPGVAPQVRVWAESVGSASPDIASRRLAEDGEGRAAGVSRAANPDTAVVRIWVEDNGIGIPKDAQHRIFDMFQRATSEYEGNGIGLAIVRKVVSRMGGRVGVESEPGRGSRFWVELQQAGVGRKAEPLQESAHSE